MTPHYKMIEIGGKELAVFYPQFKDDDGYKIIDPENRFPIELKNHTEYMSFLETLVEREQELKDGLTTLADLIEEMDMLARGPKGDTRYMWVKYADDEQGNGMSDDPTGKKYIGFAFNKDTETPSEEPSDYRFVKYVADYEGLEIGGRNLVRSFNSEAWIINNPSVQFNPISDNEAEISGPSGTAYRVVFEVDIEPNTNYIMHVETSGEHHYVLVREDTEKRGRVRGGLNSRVLARQDMQGYQEIKFTSLSNAKVLRFEVGSANDGNSYNMIIKNLKLEKGIIATDWSPAPEDIYARIDDIDAEHVGLGNVQNYGIASQSQAENGTSNSAYMTPLRTKQAIEKLSPNYVIDTEIGEDYILKKFSDGTFELKGHTVITTEIETELSEIYRSSNLSLQDVLNDLLPANAKMVYSNAWLMDGYFNTWMATSGVSNPVTDNTIRFRLFSYSSRPSSDYIIGYEIAGTWS